MSWNPDVERMYPEAKNVDALETVILPRSRDLGTFMVKRALPAPERQMVGPFIFFDQAGPAEFVTNQGIDVRPHPHIGLSTVTYLFKGEFHHRDSLGTDQIIYPGEVNWMTAGRGITHSERTSQETRQHPHSLFGIQTWVALPADQEETAPDFEHCGKAKLPLIEDGGTSLRLILGNAYGKTSPVKISSEMFYVDAVLQANASIPLPDNHEDRGVYVLEGEIDVAGIVFQPGCMMVFRPGDKITLTAGAQGARLMLLGGATLDGPRYIWWNFVSSSKEKMEAAKEAWKKGDWENGMFRLPIGDDKEFARMPE
jgi:redox-sensitive bicupin YhaK (pirin superfamily)